MALRYVPNIRALITATLRDFMEPHHTTDLCFDQFCGWPFGTTRELLDQLRDPTHTEIMEISIRTRTPLSRFIIVRWIDLPTVTSG